MSVTPDLSMVELYHEIKHFSSKMREYNQKLIDRDIVEELTETLQLIHQLLHDPVLVQSTDAKSDMVRGIDVHADLIYRCQMCKTDVGPFKRMTEHIQLPRHIQACGQLTPKPNGILVKSQTPSLAGSVVSLNVVPPAQKKPSEGAIALQKSRSSSLAGSAASLNVVLPAPKKPSEAAITSQKSRSSSLAGSVANLNVASTTSKPLSHGTQSLRDHIRTISVPPTQKVVVQAVNKNDAAKKPVVAKAAKSEVCKENLNKKTKKLLATDFLSIVDERVATGLSLKFAKAYENIVRDLNSRLQERYPAVKSYCFGSRINGLGTKKADLDIYIDIGNTYQGGKKLSKEEQSEVIDVVFKILAKDRKVWDDFERIKGARTPLLRAFNHLEKIDCDISFTSGLSHCNTYLLQYLLSLQPVCHKLAVFVKEWATQAQLAINGYVFTLLVIFYLQNQKILPAVLDLQMGVEPFEIGCWQSNFADLTLEKLNIPVNDDFPKHLVGFFDFYGNGFLTQDFVVCPLLGYGVKKSLFQYGQEKDLPPQFKRYKAYMSSIDLKKADKIDDLFAYEKPLVIQDPLELIHNVSKGITGPGVVKFKHFCRQTLEILKQRNFS